MGKEEGKKLTKNKKHTPKKRAQKPKRRSLPKPLFIFAVKEKE